VVCQDTSPPRPPGWRLGPLLTSNESCLPPASSLDLRQLVVLHLFDAREEGLNQREEVSEARLPAESLEMLLLRYPLNTEHVSRRVLFAVRELVTDTVWRS